MSVKLDRYIQIQKEQVIGEDPRYQSPITQWVAHTNVWANVRDLLPGSNTETERYGLTQAKNPVVVRIRYRLDVVLSMRLLELGGRKRTLQIVAGPAEVVETGRERYLDIGCDAQV